MGLPVLGAVLGGLQTGANIWSAKDQQRFSAKQAQLDRDFQERMSSTSWQRGVKDMRAAGINPMLAFQEGGASSPGGAMASGVQVDTGNIVNSAAMYSRLGPEVKLLEAQRLATSAKGIRDTTEAIALQQDMESPAKSEGDPGGRSYRQMSALSQMALQRAQIALLNSSRALNAADLPGRKITGSKVGGLARVINPFARWF